MSQNCHIFMLRPISLKRSYRKKTAEILDFTTIPTGTISVAPTDCAPKKD